MSSSDSQVIEEDFSRDLNTVGIQINLAKPESSDLLQLIREREDLKKKLESKEKEINSLQSKQYDMLTKIEELQKNSKTLGAPVTKTLQPPTKQQPRGRRASVATTGGGIIREKSFMVGKDRSQPPAAKNKVEEEKTHAIDKVTPKLLHPKIPNMENLQTDSIAFYKEISKRLPDLRLSTAIEAEEKFHSADDNKDGVIDHGELEVFLSSYNLLLTKQQLDGILKEIDTDDTGTIDFFEALKIIDRLWTNKPTKLPDEIRTNRSKMCSIQ